MLRTAMPKLLSQVASYDWGFFSEREQRMHVQAIGKDVPRYKAWLEQDGKRCFIDAYPNAPMPPKVFNAIRVAVAARRTEIENAWTSMQIWLQHVKITVLDPDKYIFDFVLYPGQNTELRRNVELPGLQRMDTTGEYIKNWKLDPDMVAIVFGTHLPELRHYDVYLPDIFWGRLPD